jgi:hypothetical protein
LLIPIATISISPKSAIAVPTNCTAIQNSLNSLKTRLENLENSPVTSKNEDNTIRQMKELNVRISAKEKELRNCNNPPAAKPDLVIRDIIEIIDNSDSTRKYRAVIVNNSDVPAPGPFEIVIGVSTGSLGPNPPITGTYEVTEKVTSGTIISPHGEYYSKAVVAPSRLRYIYEVEAIANSENQLKEVSLANNRFKKTFR